MKGGNEKMNETQESSERKEPEAPIKDGQKETDATQESPRETFSGERRETLSPIDAANEAAARLERANAEKKKLLDREEKIIADAKLTGRGYAGQPGIKAPTITDKAAEFFAGSEIAKAIEKHKNEI